jgi:two-component system sensor histidine kinase RpfC
MVGNLLKEVFKLPKLKSLAAGLSDMARMEYEQALIRLFFTFIVFTYLLLTDLHDPTGSSHLYAIVLSAVYELFALSVLISFRFLKQGSRPRRLITMLGDYGMTCLAMYISGETGAPLFIVLLWITVGYGARFGANYLHLGISLSTIGLLILISTNPFWVSHPVFGHGLLVTNIVIPIFVYKMMEQLLEAKTNAEEASQAKTHFLANVSHEMRTPLSGIIGISQLLMSKSLSNDVGQKIQSIDSSARHLLNMIDDMLDLSMIETGQLKIERQTFNLHTLLNTLVDNFDASVKEKKILLVTHTGPEVPSSLIGDPMRIQQVLNNLISNAIKFTQQGYVDIRINCKQITQSNMTLCFEIIDTGIGIPEHHLPNIFDRFNQADVSISREYGGTGLGTTISRELVNSMGGEIFVESTLGKGSRFYFDLPLELPDTILERHYSGHITLVYTQSLDFFAEINQPLKLWGLTSEALCSIDELLERVTEEISNQTNMALILVDAESVTDNMEELVKNLNRFDPGRVHLIIIDIHSRFKPTEFPWEIDSIVQDLNDRRELYHAIHTALLNSELSEKIPSLLNNVQQKIGTKIKILIAEDTKVNRLVLGEMLTKAGFDVVLVESGESALEKFNVTSFDLAIVDMQMPRISGLDVIRKLKAGHGLFNNTPIIVLTANNFETTKTQCYEAGADAYFQKPVEMDSLIAKIMELTETAEKKRNTGTTTDAKRITRQKRDYLDKITLDYLSRGSKSEDWFQELVNSFLNDVYTCLGRMAIAVKKLDIKQFKDNVCMIKDSAASIGATILFNQMNQLNLTSHEEFDRNGYRYLKELEITIDATRLALQKYSLENGIEIDL